MEAPTYFHVTSTSNKAQPHLAYVKILLGAIDNENNKTKTVTVKALHDSGCAATIMSKQIFDQIPDKDQIIISETPNTFVVSVTGEQTAVTGQATIYLTFQGENGIDLTFPLDVHIHDNIDHDFILGRDFTGSAAKLMETKDHIYLTHEESEYTDPEDFWNRAKLHACAVPIISSKEKTYDILTADTYLLPPFQMVSISCKLNPGKILPPSTENGQTAFEVVNITQPRLKTFDSALYTYCNVNDIVIPIYNDTNNEYLLTSDLKIADIYVWTENPTVYPINITDMTELLILNANNANLQVAEKINQDETLTEEEKLENFYEYLEKGSYQMPMSSYIETRPTITEMELQDICPLTDEELDTKFKIGHLTPAQQKHALDTFHKYIQVFSRFEYDIGKAKNFEMDIQIDETKPHIQKFVPLPQPVQKPATQILDQMLEFDIIRECNEASFFCSNILVTKKKDKSKIRMLFDGRIVNNATARLPVNFTTQMEILNHLAGRKHVTTMDISQAFFQLGLSEKAQPYTAFYSATHGKRFCFKRAPQGLKNSPLYLKLFLDKTLGHLSQYVLTYVDDILIATDGTMTEHINIVGKVLKALLEAGIKLKPDKIHLATDTVEFIGIVWKRGKLSIPEAKMQAFKKLQKPTTPRQAKALVMALSFYRKFIPRFAELSRPILELGTLHAKQFKWTQTHDNHFRLLIKAMITHTELHLPDPNKPFYVQTDASMYCGAGRVFQKDDNGNELLLACVSRTFTKTERKYGICRKETLALLYTLKTMDFFLRFAPKVILLVDAKSILFLRMCKESTGILLRFSIELSKYEAEIFHVPGEQNQISDLLSREHESLADIIKQHKNRHVLTEEQTEHILNRLSIPDQRHFTPEEVKWLLEADSLDNPLISLKRKRTASKAKPGKTTLKNIPITLNQRKVKMPRETTGYRPGVILPTYRAAISKTPPQHISYSDFQSATRLVTSGDITIKQLIEAQKKDLRLKTILNLPKLPSRFVLIDKLLYHFKNDHHRLAMPDAFLDPLINAKHYTAFGIHLSKTRIRRDITCKYFVNVKLLNEKLQFLKENCIICQFNNSAPKQHPLQQSNLIFSPRTTWACDLIPSLPKSNNGYNAIFLAVDMFTGYIQLYPIKSRQTLELIEAVNKTILIPFSTPKYFRCDSETGMFSSTDFYNFMKPLGIEFLPCSTGAPWSNGAAERAVQTIKMGLRKFLQQEETNSKWDEFLHFFCSSHNKSTSVYGFAPEQLMFGFLNPNPTDLFQIWPKTQNPDDYLKSIVKEAENARAQTRLEQVKRMKQNLTYRNENLKKKVFKPGQIVLQRNLQVASGPGKATQPSYQGPYVIISIDDDLSSGVIEHMNTQVQTRAHFSNITLLNYHPQHHKFPEKYDETFLQFLPEKFSKEKYYPKQRKRNRMKSLEKDSKKLLTFKVPLDVNTRVSDEFLSDEEFDSRKTDKRNKAESFSRIKKSDLIESLNDTLSGESDELDEEINYDDVNISANDENLLTFSDEESQEVKEKQEDRHKQDFYDEFLDENSQEKSLTQKHKQERDFNAKPLFREGRNKDREQDEQTHGRTQKQLVNPVTKKQVFVPQILSFAKKSVKQTNARTEKRREKDAKETGDFSGLKKMTKNILVPQIFKQIASPNISSRKVTTPSPSLITQDDKSKSDSGLNIRRSSRMKIPTKRFQVNYLMKKILKTILQQKTK